MSAARRVAVRRLLGTGAVALTLTAGTRGAAWASDTPGGDGWDKAGHGCTSGEGGRRGPRRGRCGHRGRHPAPHLAHPRMTPPASF